MLVRYHSRHRLAAIASLVRNGCTREVINGRMSIMFLDLDYQTRMMHNIVTILGLPLWATHLVRWDMSALLILKLASSTLRYHMNFFK
jgi:hypothetical protein